MHHSGGGGGNDDGRDPKGSMYKNKYILRSQGSSYTGRAMGNCLDRMSWIFASSGLPGQTGHEEKIPITSTMTL